MSKKLITSNTDQNQNDLSFEDAMARIAKAPKSFLDKKMAEFKASIKVNVYNKYYLAAR